MDLSAPSEGGGADEQAHRAAGPRHSLWTLLGVVKTALLSRDAHTRARSAALCAALAQGGPPSGCCACVSGELAEHLFETLRPGRPCPLEDGELLAATARACVAALSSLACASGGAFSRRLVYGCAALTAQLRRASAAHDVPFASSLCALLALALRHDPSLPRPMALAVAQAVTDLVAGDVTEDEGQPLSPASSEMAACACDAMAALAEWMPFGVDTVAVYRPACAAAACALRRGAQGDARLLAACCELLRAHAACCARGAAAHPDDAAAVGAAAELCGVADAHVLPRGIWCVEAAVSSGGHIVTSCDASCFSAFYNLLAALLQDATPMPPAMRAQLARKLARCGGLATGMACAQAAPLCQPAVAAFLSALLRAHPAARAAPMPASADGAVDGALLRLVRLGTLDAALEALCRDAVAQGGRDAALPALWLLMHASLAEESEEGEEDGDGEAVAAPGAVQPCCGVPLHHLLRSLSLACAAIGPSLDGPWCEVLLQLWAHAEGCAAIGSGGGGAAGAGEQALLAAVLRTRVAPPSTRTAAAGWLFARSSCGSPALRSHCRQLLASWLRAQRPAPPHLRRLLRLDEHAAGLLLDLVLQSSSETECEQSAEAEAQETLCAALDALQAAAAVASLPLAQALRPRLAPLGDALWRLLADGRSSPALAASLLAVLAALLRAWDTPPPMGARLNWTHVGIFAAALIASDAEVAAAASSDAAQPVPPLLLPCALLLAACLRTDAGGIAWEVGRESATYAAVAACLAQGAPPLCRLIAACLVPLLAAQQGAATRLCARGVDGVATVPLRLARCALCSSSDDDALPFAALHALASMLDADGDIAACWGCECTAVVLAAAHSRCVDPQPRTSASAMRLLAALAAARPAYVAAAPWSAFAAEECASAASGAAVCEEADALASEACGALASLLSACAQSSTSLVPMDAGRLLAPLAEELARSASTLHAAAAPRAPAEMLRHLRSCGALQHDAPALAACETPAWTPRLLRDRETDALLPNWPATQPLRMWAALDMMDV